MQTWLKLCVVRAAETPDAKPDRVPESARRIVTVCTWHRSWRGNTVTFLNILLEYSVTAHIHLRVEHIRSVSDVFASPTFWIPVWVLLLSSHMSWENDSVSLPR